MDSVKRASRHSGIAQSAWANLARGALGVALALIYLIPLAAIATGLPSLERFLDPLVLSQVWGTITQAALSTFGALAIGVPLGLWLHDSPRARGLLNIPFSIPTICVAVGWIAWLGRRGWLAELGMDWDGLYTIQAVILAHVMINAPWVGWSIGEMRSRISGATLDLARTLGGSRAQVIRWIITPRILPAVGLAAAQVFGLCSMSFALVLLLGGGPPVETLETGIYSRMRLGTFDPQSALSLAAWQVIVAGLPLSAVALISYRPIGARSSTPRKPRGEGLKTAVAAAFLLPVLPLLILPLTDQRLRTVFADAGFWDEVMPALGVSFKIGGLASGIALGLIFLGLAARIGVRAWILLSALGGISALVLGMGVWGAYGTLVDPSEGSLTALVIVQSGLLLPVFVRFLLPLIYRPLAHGTAQVAATLGASLFQRLRWVHWPIWKPRLIACAGLGLAWSIGEVAAVSLFGSEKLSPVSLLMSRWSQQYRFQEAQALALVLLLLTAALGWSFGSGRSARERA